MSRRWRDAPQGSDCGKERAAMTTPIGRTARWRRACDRLRSGGRLRARDHGRADHVVGSASDLLRAGADAAGYGASKGSSAWPKNLRALAGRLRPAQAFLRTLGIEIEFGREGRAGTRMIRMFAAPENPPPGHTVGTVCDDEPRIWSGQPPPGPGRVRQARRRC